jgi:hypothetical protein
MQTRVDTSDAGFTRMPCYFARLQGPLFDPENPRFILAPFTSIAEPAIGGFTFRLMLPQVVRHRYEVATGRATVENTGDNTVTVNDASVFRVGDTIVAEGMPENVERRGLITQIEGNTLTVNPPLGSLETGAGVRIADLIPNQQTFRLVTTAGLAPGSEVVIRGIDAANPEEVVAQPAIIASIDEESFVTLSTEPQRRVAFDLGSDRIPVLSSIYNSNFHSEFIQFARGNELYVCWLGCQMDEPLPLDCPDWQCDRVPCF